MPHIVSFFLKKHKIRTYTRKVLKPGTDEKDERERNKSVNKKGNHSLKQLIPISVLSRG